MEEQSIHSECSSISSASNINVIFKRRSPKGSLSGELFSTPKGTMNKGQLETAAETDIENPEGIVRVATEDTSSETALIYSDETAIKTEIENETETKVTSDSPGDNTSRKVPFSTYEAPVNPPEDSYMTYVHHPTGETIPFSSIRGIPKQHYDNPAFVGDSGGNDDDEGIEPGIPESQNEKDDDIGSRPQMPLPEEDEEKNPDDDFIGKKFIDNPEEEPLVSFEDCYKGSAKIIKGIFSFVLFVVILGSVVISKGSILFIASQLHPDVTFVSKHDNDSHSDIVNTCGEPKCINAEESCQEKDNVRWLWAMFICQCTPYFFMFLRCAWKMCFKNKNSPDGKTLAIVVLIEILQCLGVYMILFHILPTIDAFRGLFLFCGVATIPSFLQTFNEAQQKKLWHYFVDVFAMIIQLSAMITWLVLHEAGGHSSIESEREEEQLCPVNYSAFDTVYVDLYGNSTVGRLPESTVAMAMMPAALLLCSLGWWENFVDMYTRLARLSAPLLEFRDQVKHSKTKIYACVSIVKILVTFITVAFYFGFTTETHFEIFNAQNFYEYRCTLSDSESDIEGGFLSDWLEVAIIQVCMGIIAFYAADIAIKGHMQIASFTIPLVSATPVVLLLLFWACDMCDTLWHIPVNYDYFWNCFQGHDNFMSAVSSNLTLLGVIFWFSQLWITRYLWYPTVERLAKTDKIFTMPMYCGAMLEQSLMFIRRRNDDEDRTLTQDHRKRHETTEIDDTGAAFTEEKPVLDGYNPLFVKEEETMTPYVIMCATMWHENEREMIQIFHSIIRMDFDATARKYVKNLLHVHDPDFYEFELNVFFDDAFTPHLPDEVEYEINSFVLQLMDCLNKAAEQFFKEKYKVSSPQKFVTPYGGRLVFTLPFGNKMVIHLKDKQKIRNRKRWSQVMYMHYLLGQGILAQPFDSDFQQMVADNTYVLALDGDVDFKPEAVILLLDLMKRNKKVAAACGRIHPIGAGPMVWYQKFEYSLSHWLQKSTEHVLGCVLCSPGCFSLFRCSALMDTNVVQRYSIRPSKPKDHVQYDQGEDRWLCTLLLQQGHRVEYSAAADAYTYAPEEFKEFFNQRRRWITSTFANILDLLISGRYTARKNENISMLYMIYQGMLFGSSILGPATIFLLIVGSVDSVFQTGLGMAVLWGLIPLVAFMITCFKCSNDTQIKFAAVLSALAAVLQMFVFIGIVRQMVDNGICSPNSFFFLFVLSVFFLAAIIHPQEGSNLVYIPVYFLLVPSMYLILMIFSLCNINAVSWGTREVKQQPSPAQLEEQKKKEQEMKTAKTNNDLNGFLKLLGAKDLQSSYSDYTVGCGSCCKFMCCPSHDKKNDDMEEIKAELKKIQVQIQDLKHKGHFPDQREFMPHAFRGRLGSIPEQKLASQREESDSKSSSSSSSDDESEVDTPLYDNNIARPAKNPRDLKWINDPRLGDGDYQELGEIETKFWQDLIRIYLYPLDANKEEQKQVGEELKELRNTVVFGFFLIDILLITLILAMSLSIEQVPDMAISWNCTVGGEVYESQMDPIGFLFIIVFGFIIVIQLCGMFLHRVFTFLQIVSVTIFFGKTNTDDVPDSEGMSADEAVKFMKKMWMPDEQDCERTSTNSGSSGYSTATEENPPPEEPSTSSNVTGDNARKRTKTVVEQIKTQHKTLDNNTVGKAFAAKILALKEEIDETERSNGEPSERVGTTRQPAKSLRYRKFAKTLKTNNTTTKDIANSIRREFNVSQKDIDNKRGKVRQMLPQEFTQATTARQRRHSRVGGTARQRAFSIFTSQPSSQNTSDREDDAEVAETPPPFRLRLDSTTDATSDSLRKGNIYGFNREPTCPNGTAPSTAQPKRRKSILKKNNERQNSMIDDTDMSFFEMTTPATDYPPADYETQ